jgi:hypothetical protein
LIYIKTSKPQGEYIGDSALMPDQCPLIKSGKIMSTEFNGSQLDGPEWTSWLQTSSRLELYDLSSHLILCQRINGRWLSFQCGLASLRTFVVTRFVSTLTITLLLAGVGYLLG